jgi:hypothetical protein
MNSTQGSHRSNGATDKIRCERWTTAGRRSGSGKVTSTSRDSRGGEVVRVAAPQFLLSYTAVVAAEVSRCSLIPVSWESSALALVVRRRSSYLGDSTARSVRPTATHFAMRTASSSSQPRPGGGVSSGSSDRFFPNKHTTQRRQRRAASLSAAMRSPAARSRGRCPL